MYKEFWGRRHRMGTVFTGLIAPWSLQVLLLLLDSLAATVLPENLLQQP